MSQERWIELKEGEVNPPQNEGEGVKIYLSLYDVPEAIGSRIDEKMQKLIISFRYLSNEEPREIEAGEHITLECGRHSGRVYQVIIDSLWLSSQKGDVQIEKPKQAPMIHRQKALVSEVDAAIAKYSQRHPRGDSQRRKYNVTRSIIEQRAPEILSDIAA